jgi:hypothetical protein
MTSRNNANISGSSSNAIFLSLEFSLDRCESPINVNPNMSSKTLEFWQRVSVAAQADITDPITPTYLDGLETKHHQPQAQRHLYRRSVSDGDKTHLYQ